MKKTENALEVTLVLPKNFKTKLDDAMKDEFAIACKKWGLNLNTEDRDKVLDSARKQLSGKVSLIARHPWQPGDTRLKVIVSSNKKGVVEITLPSREAKNYSVAFVRANDKWKVEDDVSASSVQLSEFHSFFVNEVTTWARTAVFYGVSSYV